MASRIVSLLPAATEIVHALGFGANLVGRSHECDFPPAAERVPVVSRPRIDVEGTGAEIQEDVRALVEQALSIYRIDSDLLARLDPDLIVTQSQCAVCAVSLDDVRAALAEIGVARPGIVALEPHDLEDIWADIRKVAAALGVPARGLALVADLQARMAELAARAERAPRRPRVAVIEWLDPPMAGGNWAPRLVRMAGGVPLLAKDGRHSPWTNVAAVAASEPDVIVVVPCGFGLEKTRVEYARFAELADWRRVPAVDAGRVALVDGHSYFNRPGPRIVESLAILCEIVHPDAFPAVLRGDAWDWA
jgi:iron complex transport system substrate-binding protein